MMGLGAQDPPAAPEPSSSRETSTRSRGFVQRNQGPLIIGASIIIAAMAVALFLRDGQSNGRDNSAPVNKASPKAYTLQGDFVITGDYDSVYFSSFNGRLGETCEGNGGYSDISAGVGVSVSDRSGTLLGASTLEPGTVTDKLSGEVECTLTFKVDDLPDNDSYTLEVADRGDLTYTKTELEEADWQVFLTL